MTFDPNDPAVRAAADLAEQIDAQHGVFVRVERMVKAKRPAYNAEQVRRAAEILCSHFGVNVVTGWLTDFEAQR